MTITLSDLQDVWKGLGPLVIILMTLVQIAPIKVNPWSAIANAVKKMLTGDVMSKLDEMSERQEDTIRRLNDHIRMDDERNADLIRTRILRFNTEVVHGVKHTEEEFNDALYSIDLYERYCIEHTEYQNNRAVRAIKNIKRVYDECMRNNNFL